MADYSSIQRTVGDDRGKWVVGVAAGAIAFTTVAVALRCWSRTLVKAGLWWDDWTILISLPFTWALIGLELGWVDAGLGRHIWAPGVQPKKGLEILLAAEVIYDTGITIIRISVVLFYQRIFGKQRPFRIALWITVAILIAWFIAITALAIFQCTPVKKQFDFSAPGHCYSFYGTFIGVTAPNFFIDLLLLLLPVPMLWKLQIKKTKKIALTANFLLGYCVIVVTILRLQAILSVPSDGIDDITWNSTTPSIMFMLEPAVATVSICLPAISSLVTKGLKKVPTSYIRSTWSKWTTSSGSTTKRIQPGRSKFYSGTILKSSHQPSSLGNTADIKSPGVLPTNHRNTIKDKSESIPGTDKAHTMSWVKSPSSTSTKSEAAGKGFSTKSMELERRILGYYQNSEFPNGAYRSPSEDPEKGWYGTSHVLDIAHAGGPTVGVSPLRSNPIPVPPKDVYNSSQR